MKKLVQILAITILFTAPVLLQAQTPPHPNGGSAPGGSNTPVGGGAPLGSGLVILAGLAMGYGAKKMAHFREKEQ
ncbi:MAG: hypothetical protein Kow00127_16080 [Bacteroidales bacterium]